MVVTPILRILGKISVGTLLQYERHVGKIKKAGADIGRMESAAPPLFSESVCRPARMIIRVRERTRVCEPNDESSWTAVTCETLKRCPIPALSCRRGRPQALCANCPSAARASSLGWRVEIARLNNRSLVRREIPTLDRKQRMTMDSTRPH